MKEYIQLPWIGEIESYDFFVGAGSAIGVIIMILLLYYSHRSIKQTLQVLCLALLLVFVGGYLGNFIRGLSHGESDTVESIILLFTTGHGTHFIGRVIACIALFPVLYIKFFGKMKDSLCCDTDYVCIALTVIHFFNRVACLMKGCCYGKAYLGLGAMQFSWMQGTGPAIGYSVYPTQLFEMCGMLVLLILMLLMMRKKRHVFLFFGIGFSLVIFLSEFMMHQEGVILICGLSVIQIFALILIGLTIFTWFNTCRKQAVVNKSQC